MQEENSKQLGNMVEKNMEGNSRGNIQEEQLEGNKEDSKPLVAAQDT